MGQPLCKGSGANVSAWFGVFPKPRVEVAIYWSRKNVQRVFLVALMDTGAERTLLQGNPGRPQGPLSAIDGAGGAATGVRHVPGSFAIGRPPSLPCCAVLVPPVPGIF